MATKLGSISAGFPQMEDHFQKKSQKDRDFQIEQCEKRVLEDNAKSLVEAAMDLGYVDLVEHYLSEGTKEKSCNLTQLIGYLASNNIKSSSIRNLLFSKATLAELNANFSFEQNGNFYSMPLLHAGLFFFDLDLVQRMVAKGVDKTKKWACYNSGSKTAFESGQNLYHVLLDEKKDNEEHLKDSTNQKQSLEGQIADLIAFPKPSQNEMDKLKLLRSNLDEVISRIASFRKQGIEIDGKVAVLKLICALLV